MNCAEAASHFTCLSVLQTQTQFPTLPFVPDKENLAFDAATLVHSPPLNGAFVFTFEQSVSKRFAFRSAEFSGVQTARKHWRSGIPLKETIRCRSD